MKRVLGGFIMLMGIGLTGWIAYNLFVQHAPETEDRSPFRGIFLAASFIYVGYSWLRGRTAS